MMVSSLMAMVVVGVIGDNGVVMSMVMVVVGV